MKVIKVILSVYFFVHFIFVLIVNLSSFSAFDSKTERLSKVGHFCVNEIDIIPVVKPAENLIAFYTNLTGTNRGYEFFSPNVSRASVKLVFISDKGEELQLLHSAESRIKLLTLGVYFNYEIQNKKRRDEVSKSVCKRLFSLHKDLKEVHIYADLRVFNSLEELNSKQYKKTQERVLLSKVRRL